MISITKSLSANRARWIIYPLLVSFAIYVLFTKLIYADQNSGFDLERTLVPANEIYHGGPPRDGIPAIDKPHFVKATEADFVNGNDRVLGIDRKGIQKAYPIKILDYHEIVNDRFNDDVILVSYCPLCGTGMAFFTGTDITSTFGVSGLLYNSDMLFYDRKTESLWSQIMKKAITGTRRGEKLKQIPMSHTTWSEWRNRFPATLVLSTKTGSMRNYDRSPYPGYGESTDIYFPINNLDKRYHPKELVIGLDINGKHKAYPFIELSKAGQDIQDKFVDQKLTINFDSRNRTGKVLDKNNKELASTISYWFAWIGFYPESEVYTAP